MHPDQVPMWMKLVFAVGIVALSLVVLGIVIEIVDFLKKVYNNAIVSERIIKNLRQDNDHLRQCFYEEGKVTSALKQKLWMREDELRLFKDGTYRGESSKSEEIQA